MYDGGLIWRRIELIKALNIAGQGMLQAEKRATDIAREILKSSSETATFSKELESATPDATDVTTPDHTFGNKPATPDATHRPGYSDLLQQMVDLKAEEHSFRANAKAFKRIDETLGSLLDDKG